MLFPHSNFDQAKTDEIDYLSDQNRNSIWAYDIVWELSHASCRVNELQNFQK